MRYADRLTGGVGFRRSRRHPNEVRVGDALDFWRVENVESNHKLLLRAEMRLPGRAWLQFEVNPVGVDLSLLIQTASFAPRGFVGFPYWYLLYPMHSLIFSGVINALTVEANKNQEKNLTNHVDSYGCSFVRVPIENRPWGKVNSRNLK